MSSKVLIQVLYGWCGVTLTVAVIADDKSGKVR